MTKNTETMQFQTEVNQLLNLMIHSLYSNREIFLRELISNASDALDKRRFEGLTNVALIDGQGTPQIDIAFDKEAKTLTITDNGIGMSREEVIENIGTIAKSGTKAFLERLEADQKSASQLIGQFGVGFYSAFIVAHEIELITRKAGTVETTATHWASKGEGEFSLTEVSRDHAGTTVILHMREDDLDLLNEWSLKEIIKKYSDHIAYPIMMAVEKPVMPAEGEEGEPKSETVIEQVNSAESIWQRERSEIKDEEYIVFYKELTHDFEAPLAWSHNRVEGNTSYTSLLYVPAVAPQGLWNQDVKYGVDLYVQRVFIMEGSDKLVPRYLRFIQGVVDTQDLPLNISREILQNSKTIDTIRQGLTRRSLTMLETLSNDAEKYQQFWGQFGRVLKEGLGEDHSNREKIANLLRFATTTTDQETVSLKAYKERMIEGQDKIYYITADSLNTAKNSPHLEIFKSKGIEVILMTDVVDDWMTGFLHEFDGTEMVNVAKGDVNIDGDQADDKAETPAVSETEVKLIDRVQAVLGDRVESVKISKRLTDSASVLVRNEHALSGHFEKMLREAGHDVPNMKPWLEINPKHPLLIMLDETSDEAVQQDIAMLVYEEAQLLEGAQLDNPSEFVARLNRLMNRQ